MDSIISIEGVSKSFRDVIVLNNISIDFAPGLIHGIIGRNSSGKTVLIKSVCGFIRPDSGRITVSQKVIGTDIDFPENLGAVVEAPGILPAQSAYKNLSYLASLRN